MKLISGRGVHRGILALSTAAALVGTTALTAQAASDPAVPKDCAVSTKAYTSAGRDLTYGYGAGVATTGALGPTIGFLPVTTQNRGGMGDAGWYQSNDYAIASTGYLYDLEWEGKKQTNGTWTKVLTKKTVLATNWGGIRQIAFGYPYVYGLTASGLNRYSIAGAVRPSWSAAVGTSGWQSVTNLTYDRTVVIGKTSTGADRKADVLLATIKSNGYLTEYTVPHDTPAKWTRKDLRTSGWSTVTSLSTGYCSATPNSRALLAIFSSGAAKVFYDVNGKDGSAADLRGGSVIVATGWTQKAYSQ